jgi:aspartate carbamoyltransferase catalytic subunit
LCKFAALLEITEIASHHPLDGKLVITAFFEASTRTRLSFESAVLRLDGKIVSVPDGRVTGIAKGESIEDIGEMFNTYGDLVVIRHPDTDAIERLQRNLRLPLVNAGNGSGEHPTQAMLDWYTIVKWRPDLLQAEVPEDRKLHLGIIGTPGSMRAVKSFLLMALCFAGAIRKLTVVSEMRDPLGAQLTQALANSELHMEMTNDIGDVIADLDLIYMNSIAFLGDSYRSLDGRFRIDANSPLKKDAVIMHPFARRNELDVDLDDSPHNLYFAQAASAVFMRQALLVALLGRVSALPPSVLLLTT